MIENTLIEKLNVSNVCKFVEAANKYNAKTLEEHCICLIVIAGKESKPIFNAKILPGSVKQQVCERILISSSDNVF